MSCRDGCWLYPPKAGMSFARTRFVHEIFVALFLIFFPLNSAVGPTFIGPAKQVTAGLAALALFNAALFRPRRLPRPTSLPTGLWWLLGGYLLVVTLATVWSGKLATQWGDFATLPLSVAALAVCEKYRPGSFVQLVGAATVGHLALAILGNHRIVDEATGVARLTGWSHPILLGMEAGVLAVVCLVAILQRWRQPMLWVIVGGLSVWVMLQAYSKTAFLAGVIAVIVALATYRKPYRAARTALLLSWGALALLLAGRSIASALVGGQLEVLETATGRTQIWATILPAWPQYIVTGYGWAPLHAAVGPEAPLYELTGELGTENSFLAALTMAGLTGLVLYVGVWVAAAAEVRRVSAPAVTYVLSIGAFLLVAAQSVDSLAGLNFLWWWQLSLFSFGNSWVDRPAGRGRADEGSANVGPPAPEGLINAVH